MIPDTARVIDRIRQIPRGRVSTYGRIAAEAGLPKGARQVARVLHSLSRTENLPWQRVLRANLSIALPRGGGFELQKAMLEAEGVEVGENGVVPHRFLAYTADAS